MKSNEQYLASALKQFHEKFLVAYQAKHNELPLTEYDQQWQSSCEVGQPNDDGDVQWRYKENLDVLEFSNIEKALELELHQDIKQYFTTFYSANIPAHADDGYLELLQVWNSEDFERLQENIIGHLLMKQKLKQSPTVFFAVTDNDDVILSIDNDSGEVWAEYVGRKPHKFIAKNLASFLSTLTPYVD